MSIKQNLLNKRPKSHVSPLSANDPKSHDPRLEELVNFAGYRPNALLTMARKSGVVPALLELFSVTVRGNGELTESLRFLAAAEAARGAQCIYTTTHLIHAAYSLGVPWEKLAALPDYADNVQFTEKERAVLSIATAGGTLPVSNVTPTMAQAKKVLSEDEILEVVSCVAMVGWFNRWNSLLSSELEDHPAEALDHVPWLLDLNH